ncbi:preprotein translocase subunit YajC [Microbacterium telephonicum]|uniref:Preprotein translocase subunit YajC n=1 Tax=Microbacterium telephonicum TaxID=1714841 RepID=A0A498C9P7_9MICO|nr:preprotein translocase subunit YajC [Microbacterium telephonicum]RLK49168.1 preprotein translocase subunit YajC [Microbacterium telephonicum]
MFSASTQQSAQADPVMSFFAQYGMIIILVALIIFMFWSSRRRAQRNKAEQEAKARAMVPGVKVLLQGGLYGVLTEFDGEDLSKSAKVELAPGVEIEVHSQAILRIVEDETLTEDEFIEAEVEKAEYESDVEAGVVTSMSDDIERRHHDAAAAAETPAAPAETDDKPKA